VLRPSHQGNPSAFGERPAWVVADASQTRPWWLWANLLSLDAPVVAVLWLWAFAEATGERVPGSVYACLAGVVWLIYTIDRLLDARRLRATAPASARHVFHVEQFATLRKLIPAVILLVTLLAWRELPWHRILILAIPAAASAVYLAFLRRTAWIPKELACGAIFALGTTLYLAESFPPAMWTLVGWFGLLCTANCLCISRWEAKLDRLQDPAAASIRRPGLIRLLPELLVVLCAGPLLLPSGGETGTLSWAISLAAAGLGLLLAGEPWISLRARRVLADVVLCTPLCTAWF